MPPRYESLRRVPSGDGGHLGALLIAPMLDSPCSRGYLGHMSEESQEDGAEEATPPVSTESMGSKLDPDFIPDESQENPNQERAREHPEETGS
jgi:hypothetical protein